MVVGEDWIYFGGGWLKKKVCFLGGGGGAQWAKFSILLRNVK